MESRQAQAGVAEGQVGEGSLIGQRRCKGRDRLRQVGAALARSGLPVPARDGHPRRSLGWAVPELMRLARLLAPLRAGVQLATCANRLLRDQEMVERWRTLDELPADDRSRILYVVDGLIRDSKARRAYSAAS